MGFNSGFKGLIYLYWWYDIRENVFPLRQAYVCNFSANLDH